jgi:predicted dehydrogenase
LITTRNLEEIIMSDGRVRFALVGAGAISQSYAKVLQRSQTARLVAVADVRREAAEAVAASALCPAFTSYEELANAVPCDGVLVCTPPVTHPEISIWFLDRGTPVLCEKPLAIDTLSAQKMFAVAERNGVPLTMATKFRYVADVVRARALIEAGTIGEVILFENSFTARVDMSRRWNSDPDIAGGGVLIDNGTHSVDIMRFFLGPLAEIQVVEGKRAQGLRVEDTARIFVRTRSGILGSIDLSWTINKEQPSYISIYGSDGTLLVGWKESKYRRSNNGEWTVFGNGYDKIQAFSSQIDNFARAIRGQEPLVVTRADALASVEVIETAYAALRRNRWQRIPRRRRGVTGAVP